MSYEAASALATKKRKVEKVIRITKYNLDLSLCKNCNESLSYEKRKNKFCSHSCAASFNNLGVIRNVISGKWRKKQCFNCGKITENVKFCSRACHSIYKKDQRRIKIEQLDALINYRRDTWYLIEIRNHSCEICNTSTWNREDIPLDVHHKDGNSDNNKLFNLLLICPNCHRQTDNHGGKNKSNGRDSKRKKYRRDRYFQGLSY